VLLVVGVLGGVSGGAVQVIQAIQDLLVDDAC